MAAEARNYLMSIEEWQLLRKEDKADRKEVEVEKLDSSELPKQTTVPEAEDDDEEAEDDKSCIIF